MCFLWYFLKGKKKRAKGAGPILNLYEYFCVYILLWCTWHLIIIIMYEKMKLYCCDLIQYLNMLGAGIKSKCIGV